MMVELDCPSLGQLLVLMTVEVHFEGQVFGFDQECTWVASLGH